jgi:cation transport ATPase
MALRIAGTNRREGKGYTGALSALMMRDGLYDVVLLGNNLARFADTLAIARWTRRIIWQNFVGTVAVDSIGIGLAAFGFLNPLLAAFIHVASEMTFILNSARLLPTNRGRAPARS